MNRASYAEIGAEPKYNGLVASFVTASAVLATMVLLTKAAPVSLWTSSAVRTVPAQSVATSTRLASSIPVVASEYTVAPSEAITANPPTSESMPTSFVNYLTGSLAVLAGLCALIWSRNRKQAVLDALDLHVPPMAMASTSAVATETTYHFIVSNAKFMLWEEEHAMELLREKRRYLKEHNIPQDFWIVPCPEFLDQIPEIDKRVIKPACALVSTDEKWLRFMKTRYDRVLMGSFKGSSDISKALTTKGGDPIAAVPKWDVPEQWTKGTVPYPKYAEDWFHIFLVNSKLY